MKNSEEKFEQWRENLPDFVDAQAVVLELADLDQKIILLRRKIEKADEQALAASGNPRSNETRIARNNAVSDLKDELAELEGNRARLNWLYDFMRLTKDIGYVINGARFVNKAV